MNKRRIICAACCHKDHTEVIILGVRHWDRLMQTMFKHVVNSPFSPILALQGKDFIQGFIDDKGKFLDRKEAFKVATAAWQILKKPGPEGSDKLYSEDLY